MKKIWQDYERKLLLTTSTPELLYGQMIHSLDNKSNTFYEQHIKQSSSVFAITTIFETTVFLRVLNYPSVARILEPQMVSLPPDTAESFCYYNTVVLNLSNAAISSLEHLCRQLLIMFTDCTDDIKIQNGKRFPTGFSSQIAHTARRLVSC